SRPGCGPAREACNDHGREPTRAPSTGARPGSTRVVTDSSCDLPQELVDALRIEIVPLTIRFGDEELVDREELSTDEFWQRLERTQALPHTAAPRAGALGAQVRSLQT